MPDNTTLKHYYGSYYTGEVHEQATVEMKMGLPRRFALNILKEYSPEAGRDTVNIMDFGGGDGILAKEIASLLLKKGLKKALITVVDMSKTKCISEDKRVKIVSYETIEKIKKEKFDIVIASAVLEHIPNPLNEFSMLLEALKPSGFFYARTPYIVPVMKLCALFNIHVDFGYPGHLHDLGQRFWENSLNVIGKETRYKITASKPSVVGSVFAVHPVQTILAYILKFPWYILRKNYGIVGGWEIFIIRE
jgi:2-polyprenyl-3-methyl-5-hydroxy-6-metoxy-1,4-benzoquinol methylase